MNVCIVLGTTQINKGRHQRTAALLLLWADMERRLALQRPLMSARGTSCLLTNQSIMRDQVIFHMNFLRD